MIAQVIDHEQLEVEAETIAAAAEAEPELRNIPPAEALAESAGEEKIAAGDAEVSWTKLMEPIFQVVDTLVLPQWNLREEEKAELSASTGQILDQIFPGGLANEKWAPYVRLVAVSCTVILTRIDPETRKLPPIGLPKPKERTGLENKPAIVN